LAGPIGRFMVVLLGMRYVGLASSLLLLRVSSGPAGNNDSLFAQIGVDQVAGFVASGDWRRRFQSCVSFAPGSAMILPSEDGHVYSARSGRPPAGTMPAFTARTRSQATRWQGFSAVVSGRAGSYAGQLTRAESPWGMVSGRFRPANAQTGRPTC